jgi:DNA-binding cell septation regulator SpoVG
MKITEVTVTPIKPNNGLVAIASLVIDDSIYLGSIGVHRKLDNSGYRITYPYKKIFNKQMDIYHPIRIIIGKLIEQEVVNKAVIILEKSNEYVGYSKITTKKT